MYRIAKLAQVLSILMLTSCSSYKINRLDNYVKTHISNAQVMPSKIIANRDKVAVLVNFSLNNKDSNAYSLKFKFLESIGESHINNMIDILPHVTIINKNSISKLASEQKILEFIGEDAVGQGNEYSNIADYIILGQIDEYTFSNKLVNSITDNLLSVSMLAAQVASRNEHSSTYVAYNPTLSKSYKYTSTIGGTLKIFDVFTGKEVSSRTFFDKKTTRSSAQDSSSSSIIHSSQSTRQADEINTTLVGDTLKSALQKIKLDLLNAIRPSGFVVERRDLVVKNSDSIQTIFKVSMGEIEGLKYKDKVKVEQVIFEENPITEEKESIVVTFDGYITNQLNQKFAWIALKSQSDANKIKIGDKVILNNQ